MKKFKIYIILSVFIISILLHLNIYAFDDAYVWSSGSYDVATSTTPEGESSSNDTASTNETR